MFFPLPPPLPLIWVIVWYRAKWQGKQNSKKQHRGSCPGQAVISVDPIEPKIALPSFWARAAMVDSSQSKGSPTGGSHRCLLTAKGWHFLGGRHAVPSQLLLLSIRDIPRGLEGRFASQTLSSTSPLASVSNPLAQSSFFLCFLCDPYLMKGLMIVLESPSLTLLPVTLTSLLHCSRCFIRHLLKESFLVLLVLVSLSLLLP